jgi:predicted lipoprotein with Yx(FWY)xxD motif
MGQVVENENQQVLYRFDSDKNSPSKSNCDGDCAKVWPAALTTAGKPTLKGVDSKLVGTVTRADGSKQLTLKGWPLYTYIGDTKPHAWKGQNVAGKWFVIQPDGAKNLTCLPKVSKAVAPPADSADDSSDDSSTGSDYSY